MKGFEVQISEDENEVCIIPKNGIPLEIYRTLCDYFQEQGYKWWLPADERCGFIFVKEMPKDDH